MVLELHMKLRLLFSRVVCFGLKGKLLLQHMIQECNKVTVGLMIKTYTKNLGLLSAHVEKLS